jgi:hypothetical protein
VTESIVKSKAKCKDYCGLFVGMDWTGCITHPKLLPPESFPIRVCIKQSLDREEIVPRPPHPTKRISIDDHARTRDQKTKEKLKQDMTTTPPPPTDASDGSANQPRPNCTCVASTATNDQKGIGDP